MDHPVLVPSNNGNGSQRNHDQTYKNNLLLPQDIKKVHPLHKNLILAAVLIHWK